MFREDVDRRGLCTILGEHTQNSSAVGSECLLRFYSVASVNITKIAKTVLLDDLADYIPRHIGSLIFYILLPANMSMEKSWKPPGVCIATIKHKLSCKMLHQLILIKLEIP